MVLRSRKPAPVWSICLLAAACLLAPGTASAQYQSFYDSIRPDFGSTSDTETTPTPTPTATPTPQPDVLYLRATHGPERAPFPATVPAGDTLTVSVDVGSTGASPAGMTVAAMALDGAAGSVMPSRGTVIGSGTWTTSLRVGTEPGSYPLLFVAQDSSGKAEAASVIATVNVVGSEIALYVRGTLLSPIEDDLMVRSRHRSWRREIAIRSLMNPNWMDDIGSALADDLGFQAAVAAACRLDRERIGMSGEWPEKESFQSYARLEKIMSKYWAETGITLSAATANEVGNLFLAWRRAPQLTVTMNEAVARSLGTGVKVVKVGNVMNGVSAALIVLDFWNNMSSAETPVEAREAWHKAGYASLDLYLSNVVANTFGAAAALPGMFVSYILTNSYDTLIGGYKQCWFKKMVEIAAAEDYLGEDIHDTLAVRRTMAAMKSSKGLKGTLLDWWAAEAPTWAGWMGGCGNWDLAEARGYREAFVDRLMRTSQVEVNGKVYHPWSFYYSVSQMLVRERKREMARQAARKLRDLEAAYLSELQKKQFQGTARVVNAGFPSLGIKDALAKPTGLDDSPPWRSGTDGQLQFAVGGYDLSPAATLLLTVKAPGSPPRMFAIPRHLLKEVTP